jgi:hypothetical protein
MADKQTESNKSRLRKPRVSQAENKTKVCKCPSIGNTDQIQNNRIQETSLRHSRQEASKHNGFFEDCTINSARNKDDHGYSSKLKNADKDPAWSAFGDNQDSAANKNITKHRRGAKHVDLDRIVDEEQKRSRNYRVERKYEERRTLTELEELEAKNRQLQENEKKLSETVKRSKKMYINLIKVGKIKFS